MSIKIMDKVWDLDVDSTKTLILLCLADHANSDGFCWPSYNLMMKKSKIKSKVTMAKHLKDLEDMGYILSKRRQKSNKRLSNIYQINLEKLGILHDLEGTDYEGTENVLSQLEGTETVPPKVQKMNLTYMNRQLEPSLIHKDAFASDDVAVKSLKKMECPYEKIIDMYHEILPMLPKTKIITSGIKRLLNGRWEDRRKAGKYDSVESGLEYWDNFLHLVSRSDFLSGKIETFNYRTGKMSRFNKGIRWFFNEDNFAKTIEMNFHEIPA